MTDEVFVVITSRRRRDRKSLPGAGKPGKEGGEYGPVYFIEYADSSLAMKMKVYFRAGLTAEVVRDDSNTWVKRALNANDIGIPYIYINVIMDDAPKRER